MARGQIDSNDISAISFGAVVKECQSCADSADWANFDQLYWRLAKFIDEDDAAIPFEDQWKKFRDSVTTSLIKRLEAATTLPEYQEGLERLKDVLNDPQTLWVVIHTQLSPTLKVTLNECRLLARNSFTPIQLFEFGFTAFSECSLCDMRTVNNDEALIDVFYALAGFVAACDLPATYTTRMPAYLSFLETLITHFVQLPDFDPHRLVWLVEMVNTHLHVQAQPFLDLCERILLGFSEGASESSLLSKLHKMCVLTTSPFLRPAVSIRNSIEGHFHRVVEEQRGFVRKYIFPSFAMADWLAGGAADAYAAWRLWLTNFVLRMSEKPELPRALLPGVVDDSLDLFVGYYSGIQPARRAAAEMRTEIFGIISAVVEVIAQISEDMMKQLHRLLLIAALSGIIPEEIRACLGGGTLSLGMSLTDPFLGLALAGSDFADYRTAIRRLWARFEGEDFVAMAKALRENYSVVEDD